MSADASLDLGASPVSPVRASESTNVMVAEDSRDHVHFPVSLPPAPLASLLRDCLRTLGSPTDDPCDPTAEVFLVVIAAALSTDEYKDEFPFVPAHRVRILRLTADEHLAKLQRHTRPVAPLGPASPAAPLSASRNPLGDHWQYDGTRCAALGTEPVNVHFWLEQIIHEFDGQGVTNSVTQGQYMRRLLHGQLRTELDTRISQMPAIAQAIRDQVATLDHHYAVALASCCSPDDNLLCHRAATNPRRHANEPLSQATARAEQAFRAAAALGCVLPPSLQFWAVYGILTTQERDTFTSQPGIPDQLIRQLAEQPAEATARYAALVHDLLA